MKSLFISLFIGSKEFCNSPLSANTPCENHASSRAFPFAKFLSTLLLVLLSAGNVWGDVPTLDDLDFGTPIVDENFNSLSITSSTTMQTPAADLSGFGAFNKVYSGNGSNSYAVAKDVTTTGFISNCLALSSAGSNMLQVHISGISFAAAGAWRLKTTKSSYTQFGINVDNGGNNYGANTRVFVQNNLGVIGIQNGSGYQNVATIESDVIDICVIYNKSGSPQSYGNDISLANNKAHVYINGACVMKGESPNAFDLTTGDFTNAIFRIHPYTGIGNKSYIDDVQIWNSLPTAKTAHTQTYSVTLIDKDEVLTETSCDGGVTLPSREEEGFLGWSVDDCGESWLELDIAAHTEIIPAGTYYPSQNISLYPVYSSGVFSKYEIPNIPYLWSNDWSGKYLLSTGTYTATGVFSNSSLEVETHTPGTIEKASQEFTLSKVGTHYSIQLPNGSYLGNNSGAANLIESPSIDITLPANSNHLWDPSKTQILNTFNTTRYLAEYHSASSDYIKTYATGSNAKVLLYKRIESYRSLSPCTQHNISLSGVPAGTLTGGTIEASRSSACEGTTITITATPADSYEFVEWMISKEGGGTVSPTSATSASTTFIMPDVNVTINATFATSAYEITLDKNGGASDGLATVNDGDTEIAISLAPLRTGYSVEGYYLEAECENLVLSASGVFETDVEGWTNGSGEFTKGADGTLYTNWSANTYTITLNGNSGTGHTASVSATYNSATIDAITNPTRTGYIFNGWFSGEGGIGTLIIDTEGELQENSIYTGAGGIWTNDGNVTLYAKWTAMTSHITFYDGESPISSGTTEMDNTFDQVPDAITCPTKDGYIFAGYQTSNSVQLIGADGVWRYPGSSNSYLRADNTWKSASGNVSLYAIWVTAYHVSWMVDGIEIHSDEVAEGSKVTSMPDNPTSLHPRIDKVFVGWRREAIDGVSETDDTFYTIDGSPIVNADVTFYAVFGDQKKSSVNAGTIIWSEDFTGYEQYSKPTSPGPSATVYTGTITYNCVDVSNELVTDIRTGSHAGGTSPELRIAYADGDNHGKFIISGLSSVGASELELSYKQNNYALNVYITAEEEILIASGSSGGSYTIPCDSRFESTFSLTFEDVRSGTANYVRIDDIVLRVKRPQYEHLVTNSYHNDLSSDAASPEAMSWSTASWQKGVEPTIEDTVVLSNIAMTIDAIDAKAKQIILENNATLTVAANKALHVDGKIRKADGTPTTEEDLLILSSADGNGSLIFENDRNRATVQMYSKANSTATPNPTWQYIGTPFTGTKALYNYYDGYLYKWNSGWEAVNGDDDMEPFVGYNVSYPGAGHVFNMEGELVSTSAEKEITVGAGKNCVVANSWTAPIQIAQLNDAFDGVPKNVYLFNTGYDAAGTGGEDAENRYAPGTYVTIPIASAAAVGVTKISSLQGFYLKNTNEEDGTFTLDYASHVVPAGEASIDNGPMHAPKRVTEDEDKPLVAKILASGSKYDALLVLLERGDFSFGYDDGWDGDLMGNNAAAPRIYTRTETGTRDVVSAVPDFEGMTIYFRAGTEDSEYTFHFTYDEDAEPLYLLDLETGASERVLTGKSYTFTTSDNLAYGRFQLTRRAPSVATEIESADTEENEMKAIKYIENDKLYIRRGGIIYDATGHRVNESINH